MNAIKRYSDPCHTCDSNSDCINTIGSFECHCLLGFTGNGNGTCTDIDECNDLDDICDQHASCTNTIGSFTCACDDGFNGDGFKCENVNECDDRSHECADNADCSDSLGSYFCECWPGYKGDDGRKCNDIDECTEKERNLATGELVELHFCTKFPLRLDLSPSICVNNPGSYSCECANGYKPTPDGRKAFGPEGCIDIDECSI